MNIYNVPDELLVQMCEDWDDGVLLNMSQAYSRVYQVCEKERNKRKNIDDLTKYIIGELYMNKDVVVLQFSKILEDKIPIFVHLIISIFDKPEKIQIKQRRFDYKPISNISWILPETNYNESLNIRSTYIDRSDITLIKKLAKNLIDQGTNQKLIKVKKFN